MKCSRVITEGYFVSQKSAKAAVGGGIKGPIVCASCYRSAFPRQDLPKPELINPEVSQPPIKVSERRFDTTGFTSVPTVVLMPSISDGTLFVKATGISVLDQALTDLQGALVPCRLGYAVHGSCAALMHGAIVKPPPGDIDVLIDKNLRGAFEALEKCRRFQRVNDATRMVIGFVHIATRTEIQIAEAAEFAHGLPCVISEVAAEGLDLPEELAWIVARSPEEFAEKLALLHSDAEFNQHLAAAGLAYIEARYNPVAVKTALAAALA
jgi:glycosyltransferase involved in cell wall biosynthesis